ncbi:MAG: hypothetical protein JO137_02790, partial [Hyphomicrobiales bacterium]|nr:hypothetical protein [Hyphomicrobiales bacterium]
MSIELMGGLDASATTAPRQLRTAHGLRITVEGVGKTYGEATKEAFEALKPTTID